MPIQQETRSKASPTSPGPQASSADTLHDPLGGSDLGSDGITGPPVQLKDGGIPSGGSPSGSGGGGAGGGLPDSLKSGIENLSGLSMDGVQVHYNSPKPAQLNAHAYAQGNDIHVAPGDEKHLAHEAWHVVQQKQGRVSADTQRKGVGIDSSAALESEADTMGAKAARLGGNSGVGALKEVATPGGVAQLGDREGNPHANGSSHQGWESTAHHIVAHAEITKAFGKLNGDQKKKVLKQAIPTTLTAEMLDNLGCVLEEDTQEARASLRTKLAGDDPDSDVVGGQTLGRMRSAFFEWQGGNQYQGPNTSIRAEPTSNKDDIDYDGQYFNGMEQEDFEKLTAIGELLPSLEDTEVIASKLIEMLTLTRDKPVASFDPGNWQEITDPSELATLASSGKLNRKHIESYAWFRFAMAEIGEGKKLSKLTGGSGDYFYDGQKVALQVKGMDGYIKVADARTLLKKDIASVKLPDLLGQLDVATRTEGQQVIIPSSDKIKLNKGKKKFSVDGYPDVEIPAISIGDDGTVRAAKGMFENKKMETVTKGQSFYDYAVEKSVPTSTFLPKELYDSLK